MKVAFVVFVVGERYIVPFEHVFKKNLQDYCDKYGYELIILSEPIRKEAEMTGKKFLWQKLLIPDKYRDYDYVVSIDSDIFVNPDAPPLPLDEIPEGKIAAVNERKYLGNYEWREKIQMANGWEKTGKEWYAMSGEKNTYDDHTNSGFVIYQPKYHATPVMELYNNNIDNYMKYHQDDQSILSSFVMENDMIYWLDERFNRVWSFWKETMYPFFNSLDDELKQKCVKNFISLNYFSHFTGRVDSWFIN